MQLVDEDDDHHFGGDTAPFSTLNLAECLALFDPQSSIRVQVFSTSTSEVEETSITKIIKSIKLSTRLSSQSTHHFSFHVDLDELAMSLNPDLISSNLDIVVKAMDLQRIIIGKPEIKAERLYICRMFIEEDFVLKKLHLVLHQITPTANFDRRNLSYSADEAIVHKITASKDYGAADLEIGIPECSLTMDPLIASKVGRHLQRWPANSVTVRINSSHSKKDSSRLYIEGYPNKSITCKLSISVPVQLKNEAPLIPQKDCHCEVKLNARQLSRAMLVGQFTAQFHHNNLTCDSNNELEIGISPESAVTFLLRCPPKFSFAAVIAVQLEER